MKPDDELCLCFHVTRRKLVNWVRLNRPKVSSQLSECGGAGTGCGWCIPFLKQIFRQGIAGAADGEPDAAEEAAINELTPQEYAALRAEYVKAGKGTPPPGAEPLPGGGADGVPDEPQT